MPTNEELIEEYKRKREKIKQMGGPAAIEKRHQAGQWSARERVEYFFDPGTFTEIGLFVKHRTTAFGMDKREVPAEGVITGFGKVHGRYVVVASEVSERAKSKTVETDKIPKKWIGLDIGEKTIEDFKNRLS